MVERDIVLKYGVLAKLFSPSEVDAELAEATETELASVAWLAGRGPAELRVADLFTGRGRQH